MNHIHLLEEERHLQALLTEKTSHVVGWLRNWTLLFAILFGASFYLLYDCFDPTPAFRRVAGSVVALVQPVLIFSMLFLAFIKINFHEIRLRPWHGYLLAIQAGALALLAALLLLWRDSEWGYMIEGAMICFICPTATASPIIVQKLGARGESITAYIILSNVLASTAIPIVAPLLHPHGTLGFLDSYFVILGKVFPTLILPLFAAIVIKKLLPRTAERLCRTGDLAFYLWSFSLSLAIMVTTKSLCHAQIQPVVAIDIGVGSLVACAVQFFCGRAIGYPTKEQIEASQALGQKNTVFAIWAGSTFFYPVTSLAGGLYSIWHNIWNSYQLYHFRKQQDGHAEQ